MGKQTDNKDCQCRCRQRRSGKDRRKYIDPRYRNPDHPAFRDRRKAERRKPEYEDCHSLIEEHPNRKWIAVVGIVAVIFLMYASLLANVGVSARLETKRIGNIDNQQAFPYTLPWSF